MGPFMTKAKPYKIKPKDKWTAGNIAFCGSCMKTFSFKNLDDILTLPNEIISLINEYYIGPKRLYSTFLDNRVFETLLRNRWIWFLFFCDANHITIYMHLAAPSMFHFSLTQPTQEIKFSLYKQYTYKELKQIIIYNQNVPLECDIWKKLRYAMFATYHVYHEHTFVTPINNRLLDDSLLFYYQ